MGNCISCGTNSSDTIKTGVDCGLPTNEGDCALDEYGYPIVTPTTSVPSGCTTTLNGTVVCPDMDPCTYWDMTQTGDSCLNNVYIEEQLQISGAPLNVYRMLGIHEQLSLTDQLSNATAISSGDMPNFPAKNSFIADQNNEWRSSVTGSSVTGKSFLGIDFGNIKLSNGRQKYGIETAIKHDVCTIKIKQGCNANNRITKARVERSDDGQVWYGVSLINIPDCDGLVTISFNKTVPARYWRIRPTAFNGGINDYWVVVAVLFSEYEKTNIMNIQDRILLENRDRDYSTIPIFMKGQYTPIDIQENAAKFGFFQTDVYSIQVSINDTISKLGRPFAIGDIIELPAEAFPSLTGTWKKKYLMVNSVALYTGSYTQAWTPTMLRLLAVPAMASQETQQIFGKLTADIDSTGLSDINNGLADLYQDISNISKTARADANTDVPERGEDTTGLTQFTKEAYEYAKEKGFELDHIKTKASVIGHDGMPPNGKSYTEGDDFPDNPMKGDYHRLTYTKYGDNIAPRLYRYTTRQGGGAWLPMDVDRRFATKKTRPLIQDFLNDDIPHLT